MSQEDDALGDQINMVFKGCTVAAGRESDCDRYRDENRNG